MSQPTITIKVNCLIPWKSDMPSIHPIKPDMTIRQFCELVGIEWDLEALVFVNDEIAHESYVLKQDDQVLFMIPVVGG